MFNLQKFLGKQREKKRKMLSHVALLHHYNHGDEKNGGSTLRNARIETLYTRE
jgi:hypothetical protein